MAEDSAGALSPLTEWERDLLALDMSGVPVRDTTADENKAVELAEDWVTIIGHPASGLRYQEWAGKARIIQEGREVVSPSNNQEDVYRQYRGRVSREIGE